MAYTMSIYEKETVILYNQSRDPINIALCFGQQGYWIMPLIFSGGMAGC